MNVNVIVFWVLLSLAVIWGALQATQTSSPDQGQSGSANVSLIALNVTGDMKVAGKMFESGDLIPLDKKFDIPPGMRVDFLSLTQAAGTIWGPARVKFSDQGDGIKVRLFGGYGAFYFSPRLGGEIDTPKFTYQAKGTAFYAVGSPGGRDVISMCDGKVSGDGIAGPFEVSTTEACVAWRVDQGGQTVIDVPLQMRKADLRRIFWLLDDPPLHKLPEGFIN